MRSVSFTAKAAHALASAEPSPCIGCQSAAAVGLTAELATLTMLSVVLAGHDPYALYRALCRRHKKLVGDTEDAVRAADEEPKTETVQ